MIFLQERTQSDAKEDTMKVMLATKREVNRFTSMKIWY